MLCANELLKRHRLKQAAFEADNVTSKLLRTLHPVLIFDDPRGPELEAMTRRTRAVQCSAVLLAKT